MNTHLNLIDRAFHPRFSDILLTCSVPLLLMIAHFIWPQSVGIDWGILCFILGIHFAERLVIGILGKIIYWLGLLRPVLRRVFFGVTLGAYAVLCYFAYVNSHSNMMDNFSTGSSLIRWVAALLCVVFFALKLFLILRFNDEHGEAVAQGRGQDWSDAQKEELQAIEEAEWEQNLLEAKFGN